MCEQGKYLYEFGPFRLDAAERLLLRHGKPVPLSHKAFDILLVLVENSGRLVEKETLMKRVWSDSFVEEANLTVNISNLRTALGGNQKGQRYIKTIPKCGYRFIASVRRLAGESAEQVAEQPSQARIIAAAGTGVTHQYAEVKQMARPVALTIVPGHGSAVARKKLEQVGGAVLLTSKFYIERTADEEFRSAIASQDSIVLVKGARQVGKTSLLARGLQQAREAGAEIIVTDFQELNADYLESIEKLLLTLAESIADQLDLHVFPNEMWNPRLSPGSNFDRYLRRVVFEKVSAPLVWGLDEVDRLFAYDYQSEVFGLFRSLHNKRALDPEAPWHRLTLAIAYATEAHLFITDLNQSPFNVGTRLLLKDFTLDEVAELNRRFNSPLRDGGEVTRFARLVGGQPYLAHCGLHEMAAHGFGLAALEAQADRDEGLFGDHLRRMLALLSRDAGLCDVVRGVLHGQPCPTPESFYRLRSAGVITGDSPSEAKLRCGLYATYLEKHLF